MRKIIIAFLIMFLLFLTGCAQGPYTVEFIVLDEVVSTQVVEHNQSAIAPEEPVVEGYIFMGWDVDYQKITKNIQINAIMEKEKYNVNFYDSDNNLISEQQIEYGESAIAPESPIKEGYTFEKWDQDFSNVTTDLEVKAVYSKNKYNVIFQDEEGNVLKEMSVYHGNTANYTPSKSGYNFVKWDKDTTNIVSDMIVTAQFELATYTITYQDEEGNIIEGLSPSSYTILDDASIELPGLIEKEGYECLGWYEGNTRVVTFFSADAQNKVYTLKYQELEKPLELPADYTFLFLNIKKVLHSSGNLYVYQPDFTGVSVPSTSATAWTWESLNPNIVTISMWSSMSAVSPGYGIIKATNVSDPTIIGYAVVKVTADGIFISSIEEANTKVEYEVTFTDENGSIIETQTVEEGKAATLPTPPEKEGYTFIGWSAEHYNIQENLTLEPNYIEGVSDFAGKTVSILGDSISTYKGYVPDGYSCFYPYPTADLGDVNQTWWMQVINNLGMSLLKNNSYSGTCVSSGTGNYATCMDSRLKELLFGTQTPDIIIIFMGSNDCGSPYVSLDTFTSSYKIMLDKIIALCPDSEIYIMTLPPSKLYTEDNRVKYNEVIKNYATEYNLALVEMSNAYNGESYSDYLVDSAHQNLAGMTKLAETIIKEMLKYKGIE